MGNALDRSLARRRCAIAHDSSSDLTDFIGPPSQVLDGFAKGTGRLRGHKGAADDLDAGEVEPKLDFKMMSMIIEQALAA